MSYLIHVSILTMLVTFLHEFGHALAVILTGGHVLSIQVNPDGSGACTSSGGIRPIIEAGGYLGSILFGNIIIYVGIKHNTLPRIVLFILGSALMVSSFLWYSNLVSFAFTMLAGIFNMGLALYSRVVSKAITVVTGLYSVVYIIIDYNVGPTADLQAFSGIIPAIVWMYIWLAIAVAMTGTNIYWILFRRKNHG